MLVAYLGKTRYDECPVQGSEQIEGGRYCLTHVSRAHFRSGGERDLYYSMILRLRSESNTYYNPAWLERVHQFSRVWGPSLVPLDIWNATINVQQVLRKPVTIWPNTVTLEYPNEVLVGRRTISVTGGRGKGRENDQNSKSSDLGVAFYYVGEDYRRVLPYQAISNVGVGSLYEPHLYVSRHASENDSKFYSKACNKMQDYVKNNDLLASGRRSLMLKYCRMMNMFTNTWKKTMVPLDMRCVYDCLQKQRKEPPGE